jgi:hypothetical protein
MATNPDEDPIDDDMRVVLADPGIQESLDEFEVPGSEEEFTPNADVRREMGLPPSRFPRD